MPQPNTVELPLDVYAVWELIAQTTLNRRRAATPHNCFETTLVNCAAFAVFNHNHITSLRAHSSTMCACTSPAAPRYPCRAWRCLRELQTTTVSTNKKTVHGEKLYE